MPNQRLLDRLEGVRSMLASVHHATAGSSSATKGTERSKFLDSFLAEALPSVYRFGEGDITDSAGRVSGQIDIVVEYPFAPNLPIQASQPRLYLAEGVAAAIEVKSNVSNQWSQVLHTATQLAPLRRAFGASVSMGLSPFPFIPLFAVGYVGWTTAQTIQQQLAAANEELAGVLVIDPGLYVSRFNGGTMAQGAAALWAFICDLHLVTNSLQSASTDPMAYLTS
jgi:hypothetical protein